MNKLRTPIKPNQKQAITFLIAVILLFSTTGATALPTPKSYDFAKASVIDRVILAVIEDYYDPKRIDSQRMFKAIMNALQRGIAELIVNYDDEKKSATVEVTKKRHVLSLAELQSPWRLSREIHRVFKFIAENLPSHDYDLRELEYGAANAMLATLDPHSNALPPDIYKYLRMDTAGEFGGLGIRITTDRRPPCSGRLTVVEVFENTPAMQAGMKIGDQIVRIDNESTVNITTSEAADRLRGVPGTKVKVQVKRQNSVLNFNITRRMVPINSVEWKMLKEKVGYVKLNAFQENSAEEMLEALEKLHEKKMKGLILDLRGNPGGLLHIAINIANNFLPSGTIVTTAGRSAEDRHVENATADGTEPMYPMVVLIDAYSASAAEIMAGALRNHGRALLLGETTFGKGSVQMVQQIPDGGAIKLTSGQYLTPGDISIQAVGVPPDITFNSVSVDSTAMDLAADVKRFSEADLEFHLDRPNVRTRTDRAATLNTTLYIPNSEVEADKARYKRCYVEEKVENSFKGRYETEFARRLITAAERSTAEDLLIKAKEMLTTEENTQDRAVVNALKKLKIDWTRPEPTEEQNKPSDPNKKQRVSVTSKILGKVTPGEALKIKMTVTNNSSDAIYRLIGVSKSDNPLLEGREFVFGKVAPRKSRTWTESIRLPITAAPRVDDMAVSFSSASGPIPDEKSISVKIEQSKSPQLAYNWQLQDTANGDGVFEPGEELLMFVTVKNIGDEATIDTEVELSAKPGVDVIQGIFDLNSLKPDDSAEGVLKLRIVKDFPLNEAELSLALRDWYETENGIPATRTLIDREIKLPISTIPNKVETASGAITLQQEQALRESPVETARVIGLASKDAVFSYDGISESFYRVTLGKDRHAWIAKDATKEGGKSAPKYTPSFYSPPTIKLSGKTVRRVSSDKTTIEGIATHPSSIRDVMVFAEDQKVLYLQSNEATNEVAFKADVPLKEGVNHIIIVARHDDKVVGTESLFVRRVKKE